jgi:hypothetical protein
MSIGRDAFLFAIIVGRKVSLFASPRFTVRKPLHLAPLLFEDDDTATAQALRPSPVAPARPSPRAQRKAATKQTADGLPVHSFQTRLADLATIVKNRIQVQVPGQAPAAPLPFDRITRPTPGQQRALDLLGVSLECTQEVPRH